MDTRSGLEQNTPLGALQNLYEQLSHRSAMLQEHLRVMRGIILALLIEKGPCAVTPATMAELNSGLWDGWDNDELPDGTVLLTARRAEEVNDVQPGEADAASGEQDAEGASDPDEQTEADSQDLDA